METQTIINFDFLKSYPAQPSHLLKIGFYYDYIIYRSWYDHNIYIIYNPHDLNYYAFENYGSFNVVADLIKCIKIYFDQA